MPLDPKRIHETLSRYQLADGYPYVLDLDRSHGSWLVDAVTGEEYLDFFTCFASWPIGYRHPAMAEPGFQAELLQAAANKPANSDQYTQSQASFVQAFATRVTPDGFPHHFWVSGGALAVENAMKVAFDWKAQKLGRGLQDPCDDLAILHFVDAFHGRSGYTLSVTNTDPVKTGGFPKFRWPRIHNPAVEFDLDGNAIGDIEDSERRAVREIETSFQNHAGHIAAILIEPMQGEGGDNHFRPEFLAELRRLADEREALLIFDEVQTGFFGTGKPWMWQLKGVRPDVVAFGKKTQVCGIYVSERVDEVENNVFVRSGRINSTWGGNLVDMVRCRRFIEIIESEGLADNIARQGERMLSGLRRIAREKKHFANVRGVGSLIAFTLENPGARDEFLDKLFEAKLMALKAGSDSIRFRLPLIITSDEVDKALERVAASIPARV